RRGQQEPCLSGVAKLVDRSRVQAARVNVGEDLAGRPRPSFGNVLERSVAERGRRITLLVPNGPVILRRLLAEEARMLCGAHNPRKRERHDPVPFASIDRPGCPSTVLILRVSPLFAAMTDAIACVAERYLAAGRYKETSILVGDDILGHTV